MNLTSAAQQAIQEIHSAAVVATNVFWDMQCCDADFPPNDNPNVDYDKIACRFICSSAIISMADSYQWYNGQILRAIAKHDKSAFEKIEVGVNLTAKDLRMIAQRHDAIEIAVESIRLKDRAVREYLHKSLKFWREDEMEIIVELRNCFSHHLGADYRGFIFEWLKSGKSAWDLKPHISLEGDKVYFSEGAVHTCQSISLAQISIFDQQAANVCGLPISPHLSQSGPKRSRRGRS